MDGENGRREEFNFDNSGSSDGLCRIKIHKQKKHITYITFFLFNSKFCGVLVLPSVVAIG